MKKKDRLEEALEQAREMSREDIKVEIKPQSFDGAKDTPLQQYNISTLSFRFSANSNFGYRIAAITDKKFSTAQTKVIQNAIVHLTKSYGRIPPRYPGGTGPSRSRFSDDSLDLRSSSMWWPWRLKPDGTMPGEGAAMVLALHRLFRYAYDSETGNAAEEEDREWHEPRHNYRSIQVGYFEEEADSTGRFTAGYGTLNSICDYQKQSISLNGNLIGPESDFEHSESEAYWAGVICHELLHNLGWDHPSGDRKKAVMYQAQSVIAGPSFNLTGSELPKNCGFE